MSVEETSQIPRDEPGASRRGRPPRLTRDGVVGAAIELVDEVGLEAMSMKKLAERLGVGTMTLYGYVANKRELLDLMAASLFADLQVAEVVSWEDQLGLYCRQLRELALTHPALVALLATGRVTLPAMLNDVEKLLAAMHRAGVDREIAVRTLYAAVTYTLGFVVWEIPRTYLAAPDEYAAQWRALIDGLDDVAYPTLTSRSGRYLETVASEAQFLWGLESLLAGANPVHGQL